ncbi:Methionine--tRNA ligase [Kordia antarctica]|uniref:Methionine--tRNA ligase n=1 Tax=Kordia antarctica TaxID=1218801 RepID=A0A7L4ZHD3_9FLAO|nr:class I tRNA ligase family protein [Kordia antarctica]QHI35950.1 Methionine--tRNA ligase [Kordia antarctica]
MEKLKQLIDETSEWLLIPAIPTPNGRIHLGHIAGPFLKLDIIARAQRRLNSKASVFCGSDVYESHILKKAEETGKTPEEICNTFHSLGKADLEALNIKFACYFNPLSKELNADYHKFHKAYLDKLVKTGKTFERNGKYLYSPGSDKFILGCWLSGECPNCNQPSGSYQCEKCGTQYQPEELINPYSNNGESDIEIIETPSLFLNISDVMDRVESKWEEMKVPEHFRKICRSFFQDQKGVIRLTNPDKWGVTYPVKGSDYTQVVFTYSSLYIYSLFIGEVYKKYFSKDNKNAFHKNSNLKIAISFGIDNTIPHIMSALALALTVSEYKSFDYFMPNYFFHLEKDKFSTSRGHVIWGADIINKTSVSADALRFYLIQECPEETATAFSINEFIQINNQLLCTELQKKVHDIWETIDNSHIPIINSTIEDQLFIAIKNQTKCMTPPTQKIRNGTIFLIEWLNYQDKIDQEQLVWWIKGLALLASPIMPEFASSIWNCLGNEGIPSLQEFYNQKPFVKSKLPVWFCKVREIDLLTILPNSLILNK